MDLNIFSELYIPKWTIEEVIFLFFSDLSNGKQSPGENSYKSLHFSSSNEAEANIKEEPVPVEELSDQTDDQSAEANNDKGEPSLEVPAGNLGDQADDQGVPRRSNSAPGGETGRKKADKEENLPQDRSRDCSPQARGIDRTASFSPDLPQKDEHPQLKHSVSIFNQLQPDGRQRKFQLGKIWSILLS